MRADDDPFPVPASDPAIAVGKQGKIYAVWRAARFWPGDGDIYFAVWEPGATSWTPGVRVNNDAGSANQRAPAIAVDSDDNVHIIWQDHRNGTQDPDIYWAKRFAQSGTWSQNKRVNNDTPGAVQANPSITVDKSNNAFAIWQDSRNGHHIYAAKLAANSAVWGLNRRVTPANATDPGPQNPDIAVDGYGFAYAVWEDYSSGAQNPDIYFALHPPGNAAWVPMMRVNDDTGKAVQRTPAIAASDTGVVYAVWEDFRNGFTDSDIYLSWWIFGDVSWHSNRRVNSDPGTTPQNLPDIAVDGDRNAYVIWQDNRNPQSRPDIYFAFIRASSLPNSFLPLILKGV